MLECRDIEILVNTYQRVTGNNALFLLSTICGDAMATLFERLKLAKEVVKYDILRAQPVFFIVLLHVSGSYLTVVDVSVNSHCKVDL